jgi:tetratricopeptide (TPR) repeat protein
MQGDQICPQCGQLIPIGQRDCPYCTKPQGRWTVERETLLLVSIVALVILFGITGVASNLYHTKRKELAQEWFAKGERALKGRQAKVALEDFRTALSYSPDNALYRLRLAQSLVAANRPDEARSHLLTLWRDEPGNSTVNLELARLAANRGDTADAIRYFHNAIYGVWQADPAQHRLQTRLELSKYLLQKSEKGQAESELIALADTLPRNAELYTRVAGMFREAGDRNRALSTYKQALETDRHEHAALVGAGETAFEMADYRTAVEYLERTVRTGAASETDKVELATARLALNMDPMAPRLSRAEADRRTLNAYAFAVSRLNDCLTSRALNPHPAPPENDLQQLSQQADKLKSQAKASVLRRNPDLRVTLIDFVSSVEETTAKECGTPSGPDLALLLIAKKHGAPEP